MWPPGPGMDYTPLDMARRLGRPVPPFQATASAKATTYCQVAVFDAVALRQVFEEDCRFG